MPGMVHVLAFVGNGTGSGAPAWWIAAPAIIVLLALVWFFVDRNRR